MGTLIILIAGALGIVSANKKNFLRNWSFLVNFCFSLYIAIFLAPSIVSMLEIKKLAEEYKVIIALVGLFFVCWIVLSKLLEQILPNKEINIPIPKAMDKIGSLICGFFSGMIVIAFFLFLVMLAPVSEKFPIPESVRTVPQATLLKMVKTINACSFQGISEKGVRTLKNARILPDPEREQREKEAAEAAAKQAETQTQPADEGKTEAPAPADNSSTETPADEGKTEAPAPADNSSTETPADEGKSEAPAPADNSSTETPADRNTEAPAPADNSSTETPADEGKTEAPAPEAGAPESEKNEKGVSEKNHSEKSYGDAPPAASSDKKPARRRPRARRTRR